MEQLIQLLDGIKLPVEIPLLLHGPVVHFAIAIPVIALLLELVNLALRRRCVGVISGLLLILAGLVYIAAFFTGKVDGSEAYSLLSAEGKEELQEHKLLGVYLLLGIWGVVLLKLIFMMINRFWAKLLFTLALAGFVAASFIQGKHGGELVYTYGANVKAVSALDDKIMELEEQVESLQSKCKESTPSTTPKTTPAPTTTSSSSSSQEAPSQPSPATSSSASSTSSQSAIQEKAVEAIEQLRGKESQSLSSAVSSAAQEVKEVVEEGSGEIRALLPAPSSQKASSSMMEDIQQ
ncbi:MAG: hypothetical protein C6I00_04355 [Nitratiruptor sp.]|nr:hypothetical protein [Nitratiruptor sp.]NPA84018.1 hypothetical protein [Campylobacterota bacterium]